VVYTRRDEIPCGIVLPPWLVFFPFDILRYVRTVRSMRQFSFEVRIPCTLAVGTRIPCSPATFRSALSLPRCRQRKSIWAVLSTMSTRSYCIFGIRLSNATRCQLSSSPLCRFSRVLLRQDVRVSTHGRPTALRQLLRMITILS